MAHFPGGLWCVLLCTLVCACTSAPPRQIERSTAIKPAAPASASAAETTEAPRRGAYYQDDGPGSNPPPDLEQTPDAVPRIEPLAKGPNRPYVVFGKQYVPDTRETPFRQRGIASWYGRKFHGQRTSSGERYDMYAMTAAHPTLPIPCYVRVTNVANGQTVIVRVNDRGPFHSDRIMDLSYTAALKLGYLQRGSALVEIERIFPEQAAAGKTAESTTTEKPAPMPSGSEAAAASVAATPGSGFYLQLGAFSARDNAEAFRARMAAQLGTIVEQSESIQLDARENLLRVLLGPYATRATATAIAERIREALQLKTLIVEKQGQ